MKFDSVTVTATIIALTYLLVLHFLDFRIKTFSGHIRVAMSTKAISCVCDFTVQM